MKKNIADARTEERNKTDYTVIGLRAGLEIHQRLATRKMFCNCESDMQNEPTAEFARKLRPVKGELGGVDPAALYESVKGKSFVYRTSPKETCHVELDEEPPHDLNPEALKIGLQLCKLLECGVPDEIHIMRKTVIDGSNTGGFQRTAVIGFNGNIIVDEKSVTISQIALEEEAARIDQKSEGKTVYRLNGLGIPLLEITTGIIEDDPKTITEVAKHIGLLLRSLNVQRGIGSIRQDINISVKGGARIEIKGFQELGEMPKIIENEAKRQTDLLKIKDELTKRGAKRMELQEAENYYIHDVTTIFRKTESNVIKQIVSDGGKVLALFLPRFGGLFKMECGDRTLGREMSGYARAYGLGGIIHSDEDIMKYRLMQEFKQISEKLSPDINQPVHKRPEENRDLIVILAGREPSVTQAAKSVLSRIAYCFVGVPEETRIADGTGSVWARPLPGVARMYPETDVRPIKITKEMLNGIETPKTLLEMEKVIAKALPKELMPILTSPYLSLYQKLSVEFDPIMVANTFVNLLRDISRHGLDISRLKEDDFRNLFALVKRKNIPQDVLSDAIVMLLHGKSISNIKAEFQPIPELEAREIVARAAKANRGKGESVIMGILMKELRGRISGDRLIRLLREEMAAV